MDKDAFYFPHFSNARHDRKLKRVKKELGVEGYGIYFMLLEVLREQQQFKYPIDDIDLLADEFGTSEQKVRTVICNYNLFQVDENENFFSMKFIEYLKPYLESKQRKRVAGIKGNLIKYGYLTKEDMANMTDAEIIEVNENKELLALPSHSESHPSRTASQRKVKKRKEKKSKEEESKINYSKIKDYWNSKESLPKIKVLSQARKDKIKSRVTETSLEEFETAIDKLSLSDFATGNNNKNWKADIDWLISNDTNIVKVLEDKYKNKGTKNKPQILINPDHL